MYKMQLIFYIVSALTLLYINSYVVTAGEIISNGSILDYCSMIFITALIDSSQASECTSGFMSRERMDTLLHGGKKRFLDTAQVLFPGMNFTCNGSIQSLIFGAQWQGNRSSFLELQIWRPNGSYSYSKVRSTLINMTGENTSELYQYTLTSPLTFGPGDILGYYQPTNQLGLYFELEGQGQLGYLFTARQVSSYLVVSDYHLSVNNVQLLLDVVTGKYYT